jgi:LTXXQ motif family protein
VTTRNLQLGSSRRSITTRSVTGLKGSPNVSQKNLSQKLVTRNATLTRDNRTKAIQSSVLRNRAFTGSSKAFARTNFRGQFASKRVGNPQWANFRRHRHFFVIGWIGPLFWPYFYDDFIDYVYWPYAYDTFWPYAYDDVYVSLFGPYAYAGGPYASVPAYRERGRVQRVPAGGVAQICSGAGAALVDWPVEQITQVIEPNDQQRGLLDQLKSTTTNAVEAMKSACPTDLPDTPTGRLAAMRARLEAMLNVVTQVRPVLDRFYNSLSDEQKARFNAMQEATSSGRRAQRTPDVSQSCGADVAAPVPIDRIRRAVELSQAQDDALAALDQATRRAAEDLKASCTSAANVTPTGRAAAMEQRLKAALQALDAVQPALERFYGLLSDEQKERFNRLPRQG